MEVVLLPSAAPTLPGPQPQYLTTFLINDRVAVDAGSLGYLAPLERQRHVKHVLLTHSHVDHIGSLPIFLDNVAAPGVEPVTVHASPEVLDVLRRHVFNDRLWPDLIRLTTPELTFVRLSALTPGVPVRLDGLEVLPVPVNHPVPTLGFLVRDGGGTVVFPSDTGPTEAIWHESNAREDLKAVFLEATFPNDLADLAGVSGHLTPALFAAEAAKLRRPADLLAVHAKSRYAARLAAEMAALNLPNLRLTEPGVAYRF